MKWSLSEYLNLIELRSQSWCFVDIDAAGAFSIPHNDAILFYAVLRGDIEANGVSGDSCRLAEGDVVMMLSGEAHTILGAANAPGSSRKARTLTFLHDGEYVDVPPRFRLGQGEPTTQLLCSRLKVRWPGGKRSRAMPSMLVLRAQELPVDVARLCATATEAGAASLLTRMATLLFVHGFRAHPQCQAIFRQFNVHDPILRAQQFIQQHPFQRWTVDILAGKVGMGRSSFATRFVAEIGKPPMEFITEERMRHAVTYLERTDMKISEVSEQVGYRSEAAFTRRFTRLYGMTPSEMRRRRETGLRNRSAAADTPEASLVPVHNQHCRDLPGAQATTPTEGKRVT